MTHDNGPTEEKPFGNPFMQQQLGSMYPTHSPGSVILILFVVGIVFIPVGVSVVFLSDQIYELDVQYDHHSHHGKYRFNGTGEFNFPLGNETFSQGRRTMVKFTVDKQLNPPVYMYYRLVGFHQNYRQYAKSRDDSQLGGETGDVLEDCWPFEHPSDFHEVDDDTPITISETTDDGVVNHTHKLDDMTYNPCGSIAWSMFNDTLAIHKIPDEVVVSPESVTPPPASSLICDGEQFDEDGESTIADNCVKKGIALEPDVDSRFKLPSKFPSTHWSRGGHESDNSFLKHGYYMNEAGHRLPNVTDEDLMVWMRTAGLPDFRKLYRKIEKTVPAGDYVLAVKEFYDTAKFGAEKHLILATTSGFGGRHFVLGIALILLGCVAFVLAVAFIIITVVKNAASK